MLAAVLLSMCDGATVHRLDRAVRDDHWCHRYAATYAKSDRFLTLPLDASLAAVAIMVRTRAALARLRRCRTVIA
jgi:hypothetical protein